MARQNSNLMVVTLDGTTKIGIIGLDEAGSVGEDNVTGNDSPADANGNQYKEVITDGEVSRSYTCQAMYDSASGGSPPSTIIGKMVAFAIEFSSVNTTLPRAGTCLVTSCNVRARRRTRIEYDFAFTLSGALS